MSILPEHHDHLRTVVAYCRHRGVLWRFVEVLTLGEVEKQRTFGSVSSEERLRGLRLYSRVTGDRGSMSCDIDSNSANDMLDAAPCSTSPRARLPGPG